MTRMRPVLFATAALVAASVTAIGVNRWLDLQIRNASAATVAAIPVKPPVQVLVIQGNVSAGTILRPEHLGWRAWPDDGLNSEYAVQGAKKVEDYVGAVLRSAMVKGEPITETRLARPGDRGFLSAMLTPGKRALSVPIDATSGIAGLVFPGDRVDLVLTHIIAKPKGKLPRRASETVMKDVRVLAMDQRVDDQDGKAIVAKTATLELTGKQVEVVTVSAQLGRLSLSLRSLADPTGGETVTALSAARGGHSYTLDREASAVLGPKRRTPSRRRTTAVTVMRGSEEQKLTFAAAPKTARGPVKIVK
ncbi:MAG: Flp pilus assembly protein CpaB [Rhodospirillaceae bacterium]|jgi:pilus assembly protein CpaB|nr:Flp pilus assembly protein CpaB [Rhodospirillaceae bacterium]MBT6136550.1 Flp pilus assembly protein CpaB [Rhodospirillaceae bacterium]